MTDWSLYTAGQEQITPELLGSFLEAQRDANLLTESMTIELKELRRGDNVARAVAGFANSEGGIILVGLPDANPALETAPGVPSSEVVAISDSCRNLLTPSVRPTIVPVALAGRDTVVIVVRVDPDPFLVPVCKGGTVFVRAPGQTVPATREQIIQLVNRPTRVESSGYIAPSLNSAFFPAFDDVRDAARDGLIRVVGGVWLRPSARDFVFGSELRRQLCSEFGKTTFCLYPALGRFQWRRHENRPHCRETGFTASTATFSVEYPDDHAVYRVTATFRRDGFRVAYALDLELRVQDLSVRTAEPRISREELAAAILLGIETVGVRLPELISTLAGSAPTSVDPVHVWVHAGARSLEEVLDLERVHRPADNRVGSQWGWQAAAPQTFDDAVATVLFELERMYLDLGLADAEAIAAQDVERGRAERQRILADFSGPSS